MSEQPDGEDRALVFMELAGSDGSPPRRVSVTDFEIRPLDYDQLLRARPGHTLTIPIEVFNGRILDTDIGTADTAGYAHVNATLESPFTAKAISLVKGGWLPSSLAAHRARTIILVDRNVVTEIVSRFDGGLTKGRDPDFLDLFAEQPVRINPLLYAMEGKSRSTPTPEEVAQQLNEVTYKLRKALPRAKQQVGPKSFEGILGLMEDTRRGMAGREAFLLRIAPVLQSPVGRARAERCWNDIHRAADECGVPRNSLLVLAALSCASVPNGASPAAGLLKFRPGYDTADAYNALCDLRSLELYIRLCAEYSDEIIHLCTADRSLALFWTGVRVSDIAKGASGATFLMDPVEALLPAAAHTRWRKGLGLPES